MEYFDEQELSNTSLIGFDKVLTLLRNYGVSDTCWSLKRILYSLRNTASLYKNSNLTEWFDFWSAIMCNIQECQTSAETIKLILICGFGWDPNSEISILADKLLIDLKIDKIRFVPPLKNVRGGGLYIHSFENTSHSDNLLPMSDNNILHVTEKTVESWKHGEFMLQSSYLKYDESFSIFTSPDGKHLCALFHNHLVFLRTPDLVPLKVFPVSYDWHDYFWMNDGSLLLFLIKGSEKRITLLHFSIPEYEILWKKSFSGCGNIDEISDGCYFNITRLEGCADFTCIDLPNRVVSKIKSIQGRGIKPVNFKDGKVSYVCIESNQLVFHSLSGNNKVIEDDLDTNEKLFDYDVIDNRNILVRRTNRVCIFNTVTGERISREIDLEDKVTYCNGKPWIILAEKNIIHILSQVSLEVISSNFNTRLIRDLRGAWHLGNGIVIIAGLDSDVYTVFCQQEHELLTDSFASIGQFTHSTVCCMGKETYLLTNSKDLVLLNKRGIHKFFDKSSYSYNENINRVLAILGGFAVIQTFNYEIQIIRVSEPNAPIHSFNDAISFSKSGRFCLISGMKEQYLFDLLSPSCVKIFNFSSFEISICHSEETIYFAVNLSISSKLPIYTFQAAQLCSTDTSFEHCTAKELFPVTGKMESIHVIGNMLITNNYTTLYIYSIVDGEVAEYEIPVEDDIMTLNHCLLVDDDILLFVSDWKGYQVNKIIRGVKNNGLYQFTVLCSTKQQVLSVVENETEIILLHKGLNISVLSKSEWSITEILSNNEIKQSEYYKKITSDVISKAQGKEKFTLELLQDDHFFSPFVKQSTESYSGLFDKYPDYGNLETNFNDCLLDVNPKIMWFFAGSYHPFK